MQAQLSLLINVRLSQTILLSQQHLCCTVPLAQLDQSYIKQIVATPARPPRQYSLALNKMLLTHYKQHTRQWEK